MKETLADIRTKLERGLYANEEQVRLAVVSRLLHELGWDIWDPRVVSPEYAVERSEDNTKIDFALFAGDQHEPAVYIEVKKTGLLHSTNLDAAEHQLRDYNRNNTAAISVLTDGRSWRFYFAQTGGEFSKKCFKVLNLVTDPPEEQENAFQSFLSKDATVSGSAVENAKVLLKLNQKQKVMTECLPSARQLVQEYPFPSLPDALIELVEKQHHQLSREDAEEFIASTGTDRRAPSHDRTREVPEPPEPKAADVMHPDPQNPGLSFTSLYEATVDGISTKPTWNALAQSAIIRARAAGCSVDELKRLLSGKILPGKVNEKGFRPVPQSDVSFQNQPSNGAWACALVLAQRFNFEVVARFQWRNDESAMFPGEEGELRWPPKG